MHLMEVVETVAVRWVMSWEAYAWKSEFPKALMSASESLCQLLGSGGVQEEANLLMKLWYWW